MTDRSAWVSAPGRTLRPRGGAALLAGLCALLIHAVAARSAEKSSTSGARPLDQVTVSARKFDRRTLKRVIIPRFVRSHSAPSTAIHQIGRWHERPCPKVTGLRPAYAELVVRRIADIAETAGAPTRGRGHACRTNVEVVFTASPQKLVDHIAKRYPMLLGSARSAGDTVFSRAIQAWYLTGTHALDGYQPPIVGVNGPPPPDMSIQPSIPAPIIPGTQADPPYGQGVGVSGLAGSHLGKGMVSEFLHVLIIVDSRRVAGLRLGTIADYLGMVALTRIGSFETCSDLPSITDVLASDCGSRPRPVSMTAADRAFLRSLYSSDLDGNLNLERGDMRDRMLTAILDGESDGRR